MWCERAINPPSPDGLLHHLSRKDNNVVKSRIHVNQHVIKANAKTGKKDPPITIKTYRNNTRASNVAILDDEGNEVARIVYRPDKPLPCGARLWIETDAEVVIL